MKRDEANVKMMMECNQSLQAAQAELEKEKAERAQEKVERQKAQGERDYWKSKHSELQQELQNLKRAHGVEEAEETKKAKQA